jgi:selenocysteine lyase/cysteine desulfurase
LVSRARIGVRPVRGRWPWSAQPFRLDMSSLGAGLSAVSAYRWCGPHAGAVVASPELLGTRQRTGTICFTVDLGIRDTGGANRVSLAPYTAESDLDRLVAAMTAMATCDDECRRRVAKGERM